MECARLCHIKGIPELEILQATEDLNEAGFRCECCRVPDPGPQNSLEWYIPTAIILFIAKPYLESFLGEMGKDHYGWLKKVWGKLLRRFFGKTSTVPDITVITSAGVRETEFTQVFSVVADTNDGRAFKLMLPVETDEESFALHMDAFMRFLRRHHTKEPSASIPGHLCLGHGDHYVFLTLAENRHDIQFIDPLPNEVREYLLQNRSKPEHM